MSQRHLFGEPAVTELPFSWAPIAVGSRVRLRFGPDKRRAHQAMAATLGTTWDLHLAEGTVVVAPAEQARPRNYRVELDDGRRLVVPHGHLRALVAAPAA